MYFITEVFIYNAVFRGNYFMKLKLKGFPPKHSSLLSLLLALQKQ